MWIFCEVGRTAIAAASEKEELAWWKNKDRETMRENLGGVFKGEETKKKKEVGGEVEEEEDDDAAEATRDCEEAEGPLLKFS